VRLFLFSGEPLLREHLDAVFRACPRARVVNAYGPTEATVETTALWMTAGDYEAACGASVAIGDAIPAMGIHLVGGANADEGEIAITGPQLALGYWQEPEQTARAFRTVTVAGEPVRAYFTGDWAERRGQHLFFRERIDFQVKIRGFRLELDEVGAAIRECGWPVECVFKWHDAVAAVVEQRDDKHFDETELRASLRFKLESHAVPAVIRLIPRMPRNENDKLDRAAVIRWFETAAFGDSTRADHGDDDAARASALL
jgi:D-alanine--poly(phosphoribitol) ligase subunit 1